MRAILLACALALTISGHPAVAWADDPTYYLVDIKKDSTYYVDLNSIVKSGDNATVTVTVIYKDPQVTDGSPPYVYLAIRYELDCKNTLRRHKWIQARNEYEDLVVDYDSKVEWYPTNQADPIFQAVCKPESIDQSLVLHMTLARLREVNIAIGKAGTGER